MSAKHGKRNRLLCWVLLLLLAAVRPILAQEPTEQLTAAQARRAALTRLRIQAESGRAPDWQNAEPGDAVPLFDLDGAVAAYLFPVRSGDGQPAGYITVAAQQLPNPVLEFAVGGGTPLDATQSTPRTLLAQTDTTHPLYLGLLTYGYAIPGTPSEPRRFFDLWSQKIYPVEPVSTARQSRPAAAPVTVPARVQTYNFISGVPDWNQFWGSYGCYSGCTPTSAINVMGYWDNHGYGNLIYGSDWQGAVNEMRGDMGTYCDGNTGSTDLTNVAPSVVVYAQNHGYTFGSDTWCPSVLEYQGCSGVDISDYNHYLAEIDAGRPLVVDVTGHTSYGDHSVAGVGYDTNGSYMIVHDNWSGTDADIYLQYGSGYSEIFFHPVIPGGGGSAPSAPNGVAAGDGTYTDRVRVTWNGVSGATSYEVWRNTANNSGSASRIAASVSGTSYDDTGVTAGQTYYYWVKAVNSYGTSGFSAPDSGYARSSGSVSGGPWHADYFNTRTCWDDHNNCNGQTYAETLPVPGGTVLLDKNWGGSSPGSGIGADNWTGRLQATFNFPAGDYVFYANHDDGLKLKFGNYGEYQLGDYGNNSKICYGNGGYHFDGNTAVTLYLREDGGNAAVKLWYSTDTSVCAPPATATPTPRPTSTPAPTPRPTATPTATPQPSPPVLAAYQYTADDDNNGESRGNGDGDINCGETIELYIAIRNTGGETAQSPVATISTSDSYLSWLFNTASSYPDISAGSVEWNSNDFDFTLASDTPDGHPLTFDFDITAANGGPWHESFYIPVVCNIPPQPGVPYEIGVTSSTITFGWTDRSSNENGFNIYRWSGAAVDFVYLDHTAANVHTYTDRNLPCDAQQWYKVTAFNTDGESARTGWLEARTAACGHTTVYLPLVLK